MSFALSVPVANYILNYLFKGAATNTGFYATSVLQLRNSADSVLATINPSFSAASAGLLVGSPLVDAVTTAGTIDDAIHTSNSQSILDTDPLTVGVAGSGADVILDTLTAGGSVTVENYNVAVLGNGATGVKLNVALRNSIANLFAGKSPVARIVTATPGSTAVMRFYSGTPPDSADTAPTGTLLWEREMLTADFGTVASGALGLTASVAVNASATGTIGYGRLSMASGPDLQFLLATDGSANAQVDSMDAVSGNPLTLTAFVVSLVP